jgi:hypothetical protein
MLLHANWKDKELFIDSVPVLIKRGQFMTSQVKLAKRWKWSRAKVQRFLNGLKTVQQIEHQTSTQYSLITICNYERYQSPEKESEHQTEHLNEHQTSIKRAQLRIDKKDKNTIHTVAPQLELIKTEPQDNSPDAPKHLSRFKEPLINRGGVVWMTSSQIAAIGKKCKNEQEVYYWIDQLNDYAERKPKEFKELKCHARTIMNWRNREIGKGNRWLLGEGIDAEWGYFYIGNKSLIREVK